MRAGEEEEAQMTTWRQFFQPGEVVRRATEEAIIDTMFDWAGYEREMQKIEQKRRAKHERREQLPWYRRYDR